MTFKRITIDPDQLAGTPCIRGLRIPVSTVVGMVADGMTDAEILEHYPDLEPDDIREALRFASEAVRERSSRCDVRSEVPGRQQADLLLLNLPELTHDLEEGALVTIEPSRIRVRSLPLS